MECDSGNDVAGANQSRPHGHDTYADQAKAIPSSIKGSKCSQFDEQVTSIEDIVDKKVDPLELDINIKKEDNFQAAGNQNMQIHVMKKAMNAEEVLKTLWQDPTYKDVIITTTDCSSGVACHSSILRMASTYLNQMLCNAIDTESKIYIHIENFPSQVVRTFIKRMYCVNTGKETDPVTIIQLLRTLKISSKANKQAKSNVSQDSTNKKSKMKSKPRAAQSLAPVPQTQILPDVKEVENCPAKFETVHDKGMLDVKGKAFLREEYKAHRLPGFAEDDFMQKEKNELLEAVWNHYKIVHGLPKGPDMWCKRCYTKLTRLEKTALCANKKILAQQWCSGCFENPSDIPRFNPDPEEGILALGGVIDVCNICCQKFNSEDNHVCRPYDEEEEREKSKVSNGTLAVCTICRNSYSSGVPHTCQPYKRPKRKRKGNPEDEDNFWKQRMVREEALCIECGKKFRNKMYLEFHMNVHKGLTPYVCDFEGCDFKSHSVFSLDLHASKQGHNARKPENSYKKCRMCKEFLGKGESQESHNEKHHNSDLPFSCEGGCEFRANSEADVLKHRERTHPVQCPHCIVVIRKNVMKAHLMKHHSEGLPFECPECAYRAVSTISIKQHAAKWHNGSWQRGKWCPGKARKVCKNGCGKTFTQGYTMNRHIKYGCTLTKDKATVGKTDKIRKRDMKRKSETKYNDLMMKYTNYSSFGGELG